MRNHLIVTMVVLFSSGCVSAPDRTIVEFGVGSGSLLSESTLEGNIPVETLVKSRVGVEWEVFSDEDGIALDLGVGAQTYGDVGSGESAVGVDTTIRLTLAPSGNISPYVIFSASYDQTGSPWEGTDVDYTFANTFGGGLSFQIDEKSTLFVDYRWMHFSNGASFHSDSFRETFGLETSNQNPGFEAGLITVGYALGF